MSFASSDVQCQCKLKVKVTKQAKRFLILIENISLSKFINLEKKEIIPKNINHTNSTWNTL